MKKRANKFLYAIRKSPDNELLRIDLLWLKVSNEYLP